MPDQKTKRNLRVSIAEGSFNSASNSIVDNYTAPYALALNAHSSEIGIMSSFQSLAYILAQLPGAKLTGFLSRKAVWTIGTAISKIFILSIIFLPILFPNPVTVLIALLGLYSFFNSMRGPAWSSLVGDIVPPEIRGSYFGKRNMIIGISGMLGMLIGGIALTWYGFPTIFAFAFTLGVASILVFRYTVEASFKKTYRYKNELSISPGDISRSIRSNKAFAYFTTYVSFLNFATDIAAPFVVVYILKDLGISYFWFAVAVALQLLVKYTFHRYWGKLVDRWGEKKILLICGVMVSFVPFFYAFSSQLWHVIVIKMFDGFSWAGYDMANFNFLLAVTPPQQRPKYVANFNILTGTGSMAGSALGAFLVLILSGSTIMFFYGLQIIFFVSFVLRLSSVSILSRVKRSGAIETNLSAKHIVWQAVAKEPAKDVRHIWNTTSGHSQRVADAHRRFRVMRDRVSDKDCLPFRVAESRLRFASRKGV